MAFDYVRTARTSNRLLEQFGQVVTITHVEPGTYDPATGGVTNTTTTQLGSGIIMQWETRQIDGELIKTNDKKLLLSPLNTLGSELTAPVLGDTITDVTGTVYTFVVPLKTINPAGTTILYECNVRA